MRVVELMVMLESAFCDFEESGFSLREVELEIASGCDAVMLPLTLSSVINNHRPLSKRHFSHRYQLSMYV